MILTHQAYQVEIYEKPHQVAGRNGVLKLGDFKFESGRITAELINNIYGQANKSK